MNTIAIITIAIVIFMSGYAIYLLNKQKEKLTDLQGLTAALTVGTLTGLLVGYQFAVLSQDIFLAAGVGIITGFIFGFLAGQPTGILPILNGSISGLLSGIIGALLGFIISLENPFLMSIILLVFYVVILGFLILFIKVESNEKLTLDTLGLSPFMVISAGVVILSLFLFVYSSGLNKAPANEQTQQTQTTNTTNSSGSAAASTEMDVTKENTPVVKMEVTEAGYTPNIIRVKKGVPVQFLIHNPLENSCLSTINFPDFNKNNVNLKVGTTTLTFTPSKTGQYTFSCGMNMFKGTIIVE